MAFSWLADYPVNVISWKEIPTPPNEFSNSKSIFSPSGSALNGCIFSISQPPRARVGLKFAANFPKK